MKHQEFQASPTAFSCTHRLLRTFTDIWQRSYRLLLDTEIYWPNCGKVTEHIYLHFINIPSFHVWVAHFLPVTKRVCIHPISDLSLLRACSYWFRLKLTSLCFAIVLHYLPLWLPICHCILLGFLICHCVVICCSVFPFGVMICPSGPPYKLLFCFLNLKRREKLLREQLKLQLNDLKSCILKHSNHQPECNRPWHSCSISQTLLLCVGPYQNTPTWIIFL